MKCFVSLTLLLLLACSSAMGAIDNGLPRRFAGMKSISFNAGAWGVAFGLCAEVALYEANKGRVDKACVSYFEQRTLDVVSSAFRANLENAIRGENDKSAAIAYQFWFSFLLGLALPLGVASLIWKRRRPKAYPALLSTGLILVCLVGWLGGGMLASRLPVVQRGMKFIGDNPTAIAGLTFSLVLLVPAFWLSLFLLFRLKKAKSESAS